MAPKPLSAEEHRRRLEKRFWDNVIRTEDCWIWEGELYHNGYGRVSATVEGKRTSRRAHRLSYELHVGEIPEGLTIDHLCHDSATCSGGSDCLHRRCVNPSHLALATIGDNTRRSLGGRTKGECKRGHAIDYSGEIGKCRECRRLLQRERRALYGRNDRPKARPSAEQKNGGVLSVSS